jgi:hypothetical protein
LLLSIAGKKARRKDGREEGQSTADCTNCSIRCKVHVENGVCDMYLWNFPLLHVLPAPQLHSEKVVCVWIARSFPRRAANVGGLLIMPVVPDALRCDNGTTVNPQGLKKKAGEDASKERIGIGKTRGSNEQCLLRRIRPHREAFTTLLSSSSAMNLSASTYRSSRQVEGRGCQRRGIYWWAERAIGLILWR